MIDTPRPPENPAIVGYSNFREAVYRNALPLDLVLDPLEPPHIRRRRIKPINKRLDEQHSPGIERELPAVYYGPKKRHSFAVFTLPVEGIEKIDSWKDVDVFIGCMDHYTALRVVKGLDDFGQLGVPHTKVDLNYRRSRSGRTLMVARFRSDSLGSVYHRPTDIEIEAVLRRGRASYYDFYDREFIANPYRM